MPSPPEQRAIAQFLERETAKIDASIAKKERLIQLLEEKRDALITRAVTREINPDAPLHHSGIEWLGQMPNHWESPWISCCFSSGMIDHPKAQKNYLRSLILPE